MQTRKILGQSAPAATSLTTLYTVSTDVETVVSRFLACNQGAATTIRVAVTRDGATVASKDYIAYALPMDVGQTVIFENFELGPRDFISVYSASGSVSFTAFGQEFPLNAT